MTPSPGSGFDTVLVTLATAVLTVAVAWCGAVAVALLGEALGRGRPGLATRLGCPAAVRTLVLGTLAALLPVLSAGSASADASAAPWEGLPLPDRTVGGPPAETITVAAGDSLWVLAGTLLDPGADDAEIARLTTRLYHLNRDVIGDDPDLIRPGQQLRVPDRTPQKGPRP